MALDGRFSRVGGVGVVMYGLLSEREAVAGYLKRLGLSLSMLLPFKLRISEAASEKRFFGGSYRRAVGPHRTDGVFHVGRLDEARMKNWRRANAPLHWLSGSVLDSEFADI